jgi:hypothetical protein
MLAKLPPPPPTLFHWPFLFMNRNDIDTRINHFLHLMNIRCWSKQELIESGDVELFSIFQEAGSDVSASVTASVAPLPLFDG